MIDHTQIELGALCPHPPERSNHVAFAKLSSDDLPLPSPARDWTEGVTSRPMFAK